MQKQAKNHATFGKSPKVNAGTGQKARNLRQKGEGQCGKHPASRFLTLLAAPDMQVGSKIEKEGHKGRDGANIGKGWI